MSAIKRVVTIRAAIAFGLVGCGVLGAQAAVAQPVHASRPAHHRHHHYSGVDIDAPPVVPEGYAYGGYEHGIVPDYAPGYGPGYMPGAGFFIAPGLGLDAPGYGYNGY